MLYEGDELVAMVRERIGPVAAFRRVTVVPALPKTRSGKILRRTIRGIAEGRDEPVPATIDDPGALAAIRPLVAPGPDGSADRTDQVHNG